MNRQKTIWYLLLLVLTIVTAGPSYAQSRFTGHVIDVESGDRIVVRIDTWNVTIQLHGIICPTDPPEAAMRAREYTMRRVLYSDVQVSVRGTGSKETIYGEVRTYDGKSLNAELVQVGLAYWAKVYAPNREDIARLENDARIGRRGIWGAANALDVLMPATPPPYSSTRTVTAPLAPKPTATATPAPDTMTPPSTPLEVSSTPAPILQEDQPTTEPSLQTPVPKAPGLRSSLSNLRARGSRLKQKVEISPHATPFVESIWIVATIAGLLAFGAQIILAGGFVRRRLPYQSAVSLGVAIAGGLLAPLPYLAAVHMFTFANGSVLSLFAPPAIALSAWASVALCRREQILRSAPSAPPMDLEEQSTQVELVKVRGTATPLPGTAPFVSQIGHIPAVYLKEITYSYESVQSDPQHSPSYNPRKKSGRRSTRYEWTVIYKETSQSDFLLSGDDDGRVLVLGERATYLPLRIARFYNGVPVEAWFSRPYPGDTRTEVEFISIDAPVVVWGRCRRTASASPHTPAFMIANASYQNTLVVEGDETRIWTRRPLVGLLLTLFALFVSLFLVYGLATPGALGGR